jgi:hypothetical protein
MLHSSFLYVATDVHSLAPARAPETLAAATLIAPPPATPPPERGAAC